MSWSYWDWVGCSVAISAAILLLTVAVLLILLVENDTIFYGIVAQLLNIKRCFLDVHHNVIRKDENFTDSVQKAMRQLDPSGTGLFKEAIDALNKNADLEQDNSSDSAKAEKNASQTSNGAAKNGNKDKRKTPTETREIHPDSQSHPEYERPVLNVYGRYLSVRKRGTLFFIVTLTTIIISGALIAAFNSLFLASSSVYRNGPCPPIGPMECFCGNNHTNFTCDTGKNVSCPFDVHSGQCFRWIARDLTTSDITTQLGITAGLLVALGSIARGIIQIYLMAFNKRLGIATGIHRIAAKTIGINRHTARTRCCCCNLGCHCSPCNLSLFKHPGAVIVATGLYIAVPILMIPGVVLLYYYELSVTALTFIVLIIIAIFCLTSIVWIMIQESEASSNIPGGWADAKTLFLDIVKDSTDIGKNKMVPTKQ